MEKINIALVGYGNVGRGVEEATKLKIEKLLYTYVIPMIIV